MAEIDGERKKCVFWDVIWKRKACLYVRHGSSNEEQTINLSYNSKRMWIPSGMQRRHNLHSENIGTVEDSSPFLLLFQSSLPSMEPDRQQMNSTFTQAISAALVQSRE